MNYAGLLQEIKSRAYWRVEIRSTEYDSSRLPNRAAMTALLRAVVVSFRGWPYPYFEPNESRYNGKWLEGHINWEAYKEYWRLYESSQWLHYFAAHGVWLPKDKLFSGRSPKPPDHAGYIHVRDTLYTVTEVFRFAIGLAERGVLDPVAHLSISLCNTRDCMLYEDFERLFFYNYVSESDQPISQEWNVPASELRAVADEKALEMATKILSVFNWTPDEGQVRILADDQRKLLERKLFTS
ncbi:MAG: hypothetical protein ACE5JL_00140 [Dehalococcoidia bacterium]